MSRCRAHCGARDVLEGVENVELVVGLDVGTFLLGGVERREKSQVLHFLIYKIRNKFAVLKSTFTETCGSNRRCLHKCRKPFLIGIRPPRGEGGHRASVGRCETVVVDFELVARS